MCLRSISQIQAFTTWAKYFFILTIYVLNKLHEIVDPIKICLAR
uniref:Uncharacterized protein n=1 Tax=Arundo donax TaxID=35708 RepID=A0A0A9AKT0_ARUDO